MIVKGLNFGYKADPESDYWWYEQIDEQIGIGEVVLPMRKGKKRIPKTLEDFLVGRMKKNGGNPERWTGANKAHIAQHWFPRWEINGNYLNEINYVFKLSLLLVCKREFRNLFIIRDRKQLYNDA